MARATKSKKRPKKGPSLLERISPKAYEDEATLNKRLKTFQSLTETKRQVISANHNLKIVLDRMANDSSKRAGLLDDELEKVVGDTMLFLRNAHNTIMKLGQECQYDFSYRGPGRREVKQHRTRNQLEKLILSRKQTTKP